MGIIKVLYVAAACSLLAEPVMVMEVEEQAVASRRAIQSGRLDILAVSTDSEGRPVLKHEYWVEFEDDNLRFDYHVSQKPDDPEGRSGFKTKNILTADLLISHNDPDHLGMNTAVTKASRKGLPGGHPPLLFDPRLLGLSPARTVVLHGLHFEIFAANPDRTNVTVELEEIDGRNMSRVEYVRADGAKARMWIDADRGSNIVRAEFESTFRSEKWLSRSDCELKQYDVDGVWFPEVVTFQEFHDGVLQGGETTTVRAATFNIDINDDRFTMSTMNIPRGTPINDAGVD